MRDPHEVEKENQQKEDSEYFKKHIETHKQLHRSLDKLMADFIRHNKLDSRGFLGRPLCDLVTWSYEQTINPTKDPK